MIFEVKGKKTGKIIAIESDYDSFLLAFYGSDEEPQQDKNGFYIVDDETIEFIVKEYPEVIVR